MKKLLLFLFLLPFVVEAQIPMKPTREWLNTAVGAPTFTSGSIGDISIDTKNKTVWEYWKSSGSPVSTRWRQVTDQATIDFYVLKASGQKGDQGVQGLPGQSATVLIGTTQTLPAGSAATVTNTGTATNAVLNFGIPKGADGAGGSGGGSVWLPFITVQPNNVDDADNLQRAVDEAYINGKQIILAGVYKLSHGIKIQKDHKYLSITGWAELVAANQNVWTFFYSDLPANNSEAEGVYTARRIKFANLVIKGNGQKQSGFDIMASEGVEYSFIWASELNTYNTASFALRNYFNYNEANQCIDGLKLISGEGRWLNATSSNSCSNGGTINSFRAYTAMNTNTAITIRDVSNTVVDYPVIEGFKVNIGIDWNSTSTTSTGADIRRLHYECANQAGNAVVKIRSSTMNHYISAPAWGKQSNYLTLESSGGYPNVTISNISANRIYFNGVDKIFTNSGGNWMFDKCDIGKTDLAKMFNGTIREGCGSGAGSNTWCLTNPINR